MFTNASHINQRHTIVSFSRHNTPLDRGLTQGVIVVFEKGLVAESQNSHDWVSCGGPTFSETSLLRSVTSKVLRYPRHSGRGSGKEEFMRLYDKWVPGVGV